MNSKSEIDVAYVAKLARVEMDSTTLDRLQQELERILVYIEQLNEIDITGIEPTAHAVPLTNVWREDAVGQSFPREVMLKNAPAIVDEELLKVPKVLPGEEM